MKELIFVLLKSGRDGVIHVLLKSERDGVCYYLHLSMSAYLGSVCTHWALHTLFEWM